MGSQIILYLPVIHKGYEDFLERHSDARTINLLGDGFAELLPVLKKEIRALSAKRAASYLRHLYHRPQVRVIEPEDLLEVLGTDDLIMPDEDIMHDLCDRFGLEARHEVEFDRTFLRWDREWSRISAPVEADFAVSVNELDQHFMTRAIEEAQRSSDWWRQVGSVVARDGEILVAGFNHHLPTAYSPYINGDPRNSFKRGINIELSTAIHGEAAIVAYCAKHGISLEGADLYVTAFPCPVCALLIAEVGFARCYFAGAYSMLDGEDILRNAGVELIWVDMTSPPSN